MSWKWRPNVGLKRTCHPKTCQRDCHQKQWEKTYFWQLSTWMLINQAKKLDKTKKTYSRSPGKEKNQKTSTRKQKKTLHPWARQSRHAGMGEPQWLSRGMSVVVLPRSDVLIPEQLQEPAGWGRLEMPVSHLQCSLAGPGKIKNSFGWACSTDSTGSTRCLKNLTWSETRLVSSGLRTDSWKHTAPYELHPRGWRNKHLIRYSRSIYIRSHHVPLTWNWITGANVPLCPGNTTAQLVPVSAACTKHVLSTHARINLPVESIASTSEIGSGITGSILTQYFKVDKNKVKPLPTSIKEGSQRIWFVDPIQRKWIRSSWLQLCNLLEVMTRGCHMHSGSTMPIQCVFIRLMA